MVIDNTFPTENTHTVRAFTPDDMPTAEAWWSRRHDSAFPAETLPPLGVVVEDRRGPSAMLWCYECFGVGVAFLEFSITRPGLSLKEARRAVQYTIEACCVLAGKGVKPEADFTVFRGTTTGPLSRELSRMGFVFTDGGKPLRGMALILS